MAYANEKKKIKLKKKLEKQEGRVAKVMAKRDIRKLKKGKDVKGEWVESENPERPGRNFFPDTTEKRVRDAGPFAFKKKKLTKLRKKYQDEVRLEGYDEARKAGDPWSGGARGDEKVYDAEDESRIRLKKKKKAFRAKKGY